VDPDLETVLDAVLESLSDINESVGAATDAAHEVTAAVQSLKDVSDQLVNVLEEILQSINGLALEREVPPPQSGSSAAGSPAGRAGGGVADAANKAAIALGAMTIATNVVEQKFRQFEGYARLFNPGVVIQFQHALDNLGATIGRAFTPMFQIATQVVRQWSATLAPVMAALAPIVREVSVIFANILNPFLRQLGNLLQSSLPIFRVFLELQMMGAQAFLALFNVLAPIVRALMLFGRILFEITGLGLLVRVVTKAFEALNVVLQIVDEALSIVEIVVTTLIDSILTFIGSFFPVEDAMNKLTQAVQWVIRQMYVFAIVLARFFGLTRVMDALIAHVEGKTRPGDTAAQQPQIKGLEQLTKDLALAAAGAGNAGRNGDVRNQQEFWTRTLEEMRAARANGTSIQEFLDRILTELRLMVAGMFRIPGTGPAAPPQGGQAGPGGVTPPPGTVNPGGGRPGSPISGGIPGSFLRGFLNPFGIRD
jgi:hypothetical protein